MSPDTAIYWTGIATLCVLGSLTIAFAVLSLVAAWLRFRPRFHLGKPQNEMVITTYRGDIRTGEGKRVHTRNPNLRIGRMIGANWRLRWFVGVMTFQKDLDE